MSDWVRERGEVCSLMLCHRQHRVDVMPRNTANSFRVLFIRTNFLACTFRRPLTISCIIVGVCHLVRVRRRRNIHITPKNDFLYLPLDKSSSLSVFSVIFVSFIQCNQMLFRKHSIIMHPNLITIEIIRILTDMFMS